MICPACHRGRISRRRRTWAEKLSTAAIYRCERCSEEHYVPQSFHLPFPSWHANCPRCSSTRLKRFNSVDHIEGMYGNPISRIQRFFGAPLLYCFRCRLQFYDLRPRLVEPQPTPEQPASSGYARQASDL